MKRHIPIFLLIFLTLLVSGCEVFPYVMQSTPDAPEVFVEPTATAQPTDPPPTATLAPSATPTLTLTPEEISVEPADPDETSTYTLQESNPITLPNFNHPEAGCDWLGVAGQVFNAEGVEVLGLTVLVGDDQDPNAEPLQGQTGEALAYGFGGYEIQIAEEGVESSERFWIQVVNEEGAPLTARHHFDTTVDCEENLILINFVPLGMEAQEKNAATPTPTLPAYP